MGVRRCSRLALLIALTCLAGAAFAQGVREVGFEIMVTHVSQTPGAIDPRGEDLHKQLRRDFRYGSLEVLERRHLRVGMDEIGQMKLPNGRWMRVRPLNIARDRLLVSVEVEGSVATDLRLANHRKVSIGSHRYKDGTLVITLEPEF
jgi:hypothetical protein